MTREEAISKLHELIECVVDRDKVDDTCYEIIEFLEEQEPKEQGQWQEYITSARGYGKVWYQHSCAPFLYESPYYYCPHCGMKMSEKRIRNE